ncbi:MAG: hypothetical protein AAF628_36340 [Planctomycetota bacterium]
MRHFTRTLLLASTMLVGNAVAAPAAPDPTGAVPQGCYAVVNASMPGCPWMLDIFWQPTASGNFYYIVAPGPMGPGTCSGTLIDFGTYTWNPTTCSGLWNSAWAPTAWGTLSVPPGGTLCPGTTYRWTLGPAGTVPHYEL